MTPHRTNVISCVICQLSKFSSINFADVNVCILIKETASIYYTAADK